jgi:hypothetical protein
MAAIAGIQPARARASAAAVDGNVVRVVATYAPTATLRTVAPTAATIAPASNRRADG